ncbi:MAG: PAS domain S-box protein [Nitrospirota bacterium]
MPELPLLEWAGEGIIGFDGHGSFTFLNQAAMELLGYRLEEVLGADHHSLIHCHLPDGTEYPLDACPLLRILRDGTPCSVDDEVFWRRDGSAFPVEYSGHPVRDHEGRVTGAVVIFRDITARKNAEAELIRFLRRYETLLSSLDAIVWEADPTSFAMTYASAAYERLLGYPREPWLHHRLSWEDLIHPDDLGDTLRIRRQVVTTRRSRVAEYRMRAANGRVLRVRDYISAVKEGGRTVKMTGVIVEVTEPTRWRRGIKVRG